LTKAREECEEKEFVAIVWYEYVVNRSNDNTAPHMTMNRNRKARDLSERFAVNSCMVSSAESFIDDDDDLVGAIGEEVSTIAASIMSAPTSSSSFEDMCRDREPRGGADAGLWMSFDANISATAWFSSATLCLPKDDVSSALAEVVGVTARTGGAGPGCSDIDVKVKEKSLAIALWALGLLLVMPWLVAMPAVPAEALLTICEAASCCAERLLRLEADAASADMVDWLLIGLLRREVKVGVDEDVVDDMIDTKAFFAANRSKLSNNGRRKGEYCSRRMDVSSEYNVSPCEGRELGQRDRYDYRSPEASEDVRLVMGIVWQNLASIRRRRLK
jgi:hypothetical protein